MSQVAAIGTYLPPWTSAGRRVAGPDEDAITMAVAAGRVALCGAAVRRVVLVSRDFPLLEGDSGAVLLAGLGLPGDTPVVEILGRAPAVLDQIASVDPGTLVLAADDGRYAGAGAVLTGAHGASLDIIGGRTGSLPLTARAGDGSTHEYHDPRLQREVGIRATFARVDVANGAAVAVVAGAKPAMLGAELDVREAAVDPTVAASVLIRLLAAAVEAGRTGLVIAVEQAAVGVARLGASGGPVRVARDESAPNELPVTTIADGIGIPISMPAYARAFESKIRWEAAVFDERPGISGVPQFPPRYRVDDTGELAADYRMAPLPRTGTVYTHTTIRIPVPDLPSPYSLALVALDDSPIRVLLKVTGVPAGETEVGQQGAVVLRRVATRAGIPDYGYMFWPGRAAEEIAA